MPKMDGKIEGGNDRRGPLARNRTIAGAGRRRRDGGETFIRVGECKSNFAITAATSRRASRRGLPTSATISRARSSRLAFSRSRHRASGLPGLEALVPPAAERQL